MAIIVGLTGGIGSGKTTIMKYIESLGYNVYYSDDAGRKILEKKEVINKIGKLFDSNVLMIDGTLNRKAIAEIVFSNPEKLNELNKIIHPAVEEDFKHFVSHLKSNEIVVKESAILFESKANEKCDLVILITAPKLIRLKRVQQRDKISEKEILQRMNNQMSEEEKEKKSDFIINNSDLNTSFEKITMILNKIKLMHC